MLASPSIAPPTSADHAAERSRGLSQLEASQRLAESARPSGRRTSRSYASIVRANVFTVFNLILAVAGAATLAFAPAVTGALLAVLGLAALDPRFVPGLGADHPAESEARR